MKTMKWLLRREFWEHKGAMFWAPVVVASLMFVSIVGTLSYGLAKHGIRSKFNGQYIEGLPAEARNEIANILAGGYLMTSAPLFIMLGIVAFWYCLGALYDERRDRSILFWKSLPASDQMTVLSKALTAGVVIPSITIGVGIAMSLAILMAALMGIAFTGVNLFGAALANPHLYLSPLALVALLPVYVVWALPTIGWLLLVSSWARSKVFLWAVGAPLVTLVVAKWISLLLNNFEAGGNGFMNFVRDAVAQLLGGLIPGIWLPFKEVDPNTLMLAGRKGIDVGGVVAQSYLTLASPDAWIGAAAGVAMLFGAMRLRRYRDEG